jgi:hypothetical protein
MKNLSLEIKFNEGLFKNQIWILSNLEINDLLYHYEHLPMIYLRESDIYVRIEKRRITLDDFFEFYYSNTKEMLVPLH